jgi:hypothetical protein
MQSLMPKFEETHFFSISAHADQAIGGNEIAIDDRFAFVDLRAVYDAISGRA